MALITEQAQLSLSLEAKEAISALAKLEEKMSTLSSVQKQVKTEIKDYEKQLNILASRQESAAVQIEKMTKKYGENSTKVIEAKAKLAELSKEHTRVSQALAISTRNYHDNDAAIDRTTKKVDELRASQGLTLRQTSSLTNESRNLKAEMGRLTFGTEEYIKKLERLDEVEAELDRRTKASGRRNGNGNAVAEKIQPEPQSTSILDDVISKYGNLGGVLTMIIGYFSILKSVIIEAWNASRELGKAIGGLTAITGLDKNSADIAYYTEQANELGDAYRLSSPEILKVVQIVGSLKAELLDSKEALIETTEQVLVLKTAAGDMLSVDDAAKAVTGSLNQFGESASEARRYINILAAGAKEGSSEIQQTAEAFDKAGLVMKSNNLTFEQSNALVQVLASKMITGSEAGTNLRNIFSKLMVSTKNELNPAMVGLNASLDNLAKLSPQEIVKMFGQENLTAAMTLIKQREEVDKLTKAVTGTNEAYDQAAKRMDDLNGDIAEVSRAWGGIFEDMGKKQTGFLRVMTQSVAEMINQIRSFKIELGGESSIKVITYSDVKDERKLKDNYIKIAQNAQNDAQKIINEYGNAPGTGSIISKQLKGINSIIAQAQGGISETMDRYHKARANNADKAQIQEILNDKKYHEAKYQFARRQGLRLTQNEKDAKEMRDRLLADDNNDKPDKKAESAAEKAKKMLEKAKEERIKLAASTIAEIAKMDNDALLDDTDRQEGQIRLQYSLASIAKRNELGEQKEAKELYNQWEFSAKAEMETKIEKLTNDSQDKKDKIAEDSARKLLELTDRNAKIILQNQLTKAENSGDTFAALNAKLAMLELEKQAELRNKELTEAQKAAIEKYYQQQNLKVFDELAEKHRLRTLSQKAESLQMEVQLNNNSVFKGYDAKINLLNFEYAQELINAEKTGQGVENIHRKYAQKRKDIDLELWTQISQIALQAFGTISEGFISSRNLDSQAEQITLDNQKGRKLKSLDDELQSKKITQAQYDAEKLKAETSFDKKQREIKRKQAKADHDAAVIRATQSAIQSILQTMSSVPFPFNIPLAAFQAGIAFDQVSKLAAMPIPEFFFGGYTGDGQNSQKVNDGKGGFMSILHPNELVVSNADLNTDWGQAIQRIYESRTINNQTTNIVSNTSQTLSNKSNSTPAENQNNSILAKALVAVAQTTQTLNDTLAGGVVAVNQWGSNDVEKLSKMQEENRKTKTNSLNN